MVTEQHFRFVSRIYDLPLQPDQWPDVLDEFAPFMNATASAVVAHDPIYAEHRIDIVSSYHLGIGASLVAEFNERFGGAEKEGYAKMALSPQRAFVSDMEAMGITSVEEHGALPAIQFGVEKFNLRHRAASCLNLQRVWTDIIAVQYDGDRGPITEEEKKIGSLFLDHFAKSVELGRSFGVLKSRFDSVFSALDRFHIGIFVLSPNGAVAVKNREAARLIDQGDGLALSNNGRLQPSVDDNQRGALKEAVDKAINTAMGGQNTAETRMVLTRRSGKTPYLLEVTPIRDQNELESDFHGALVFVIDPDNTDFVSTEGMQALYGLTGAEAEICKLLAQGLETDDIADSRNITRETVRHYVKQTLQKAGVNNRAQLVRLALTVNLPIEPATAKEGSAS